MTDVSDRSALEGHVIVCGLRRDALRTLERLTSIGVVVVVVDDHPDPRTLAHLGSIRHLALDPRSPESLVASGIATATALVCMNGDDLEVLATALAARELRPGLRIVAKLRNEAVGRSLAELGVVVLDVARLAAPSIANACLQATSMDVELDGQRMQVVHVVSSAKSTLRSLYGDLSPIAVVTAPGEDGSPAETILSPTRDLAINPGDRVVVMGTPEAIVGAGLETTSRRVRPEFVGARAVRPPRTRPTFIGDLFRGMDARLKIALVAMAGLGIVSIVLLMVGYRKPDGTHMSLLDALYFTVETIATVGFGDFTFSTQDSWMRLWAIVLMIAGATLVAVLTALITNALITRRIQETFGQWRITGLESHVVVVGVGSVGVAVVDDLLARGVDVVVVDADEENRFLVHLRNRGVPYVTGNATVPDTLAAAQLQRARAVAVVTSDDLANLETGLAMRDSLGERWESVPVVLRMFDDQLAQSVSSSFGFGSVRSPAALAAPWFVGAALGLDVIDTFYVANRPLLVARLTVPSGLAGVSMQELSARVRVVSLRRADGLVESPPRRGTQFRTGDVAYLVGPDEELLSMLRRGFDV